MAGDEMKPLSTPIDWPPGQAAKDAAKERDVRMVRCVLYTYTECPAKTPEACVCSQMPRYFYE